MPRDKSFHIPGLVRLPPTEKLETNSKSAARRVKMDLLTTSPPVSVDMRCRTTNKIFASNRTRSSMQETEDKFRRQCICIAKCIDSHYFSSEKSSKLHTEKFSSSFYIGVIKWTFKWTFIQFMKESNFAILRSSICGEKFSVHLLYLGCNIFMFW